MLSKVTQVIPTYLLIVVSFVFVYSVYAATKEDTDTSSCLEAKAKLTLDMGGVKGRAEGKSKCSNSYGSMYLYATVAGKPPKSNHNAYYGIVSRNVETEAGSNSANNQASSVCHDYYNNQHVNALVQGNV